MTLEQPAKRGDQQLALAKDVLPLFDGAVQGEESLDQVAIAENVASEVRHVLDAEAFGHPAKRLAREIHRAVLPALTAAHPPGMGLGRIEHEQRRRRRLLDLATALDH